MSKIIIGIDPSINSSGICVLKENAGTDYWLICSHVPFKIKRKLDQKSSNIFYKKISENTTLYVIEYSKNIEKNNTYSKKEILKTSNLIQIRNIVKNIILQYLSTQVQINIEGIAYGTGSQSALVDLAGLNFILRSLFIDLDINEIKIFSPAEVKKYATGNGNSNKNNIILTWKLFEPSISQFCEQIQLKMDDLADSFFIAKIS